MATLTPTRKPPVRKSRTDIAPTPGRAVALWLRAVLDRPLTSYHLVLGSVALLLVVGLMMVLSASSVNAYLTTGDSYYYVKRQLIFLVIGVVGAVVIMKLPVAHAALGQLGRHGPGHAAARADLHPARA